jgi:DNA-binding transcriptional regulator GbsR (MarR family)
MAENAGKVLDTMKSAGKALRTGQIVEMSGLSKDEVSKAMKELKKTGQIVSPKQCFWEPSK